MQYASPMTAGGPIGFCRIFDFPHRLDVGGVNWASWRTVRIGRGRKCKNALTPAALNGRRDAADPAGQNHRLRPEVAQALNESEAVWIGCDEGGSDDQGAAPQCLSLP